jgi:hypothetical protein
LADLARQLFHSMLEGFTVHMVDRDRLLDWLG